MEEVSQVGLVANNTGTDSASKWKRKYLVRKEPTYVRSLKNFWSGKTSYYLYIICLGNSTFSMPAAFRFALDVSGGSYILEMITFTFMLILPIMYMETFLGKYVRVANSQMYRMAPIFFGFCVLVFLVSFLYTPWRMSYISLFLIGSLKLIIKPKELQKCEDKNEACFDLSDVSKNNVNCTSEYLGFICANKTIKRYVAAYLYWREYKEIGGSYNLWPIGVSNIITCITIIILCILGMKIMGIFFKITFILNFLINTIIFILALGKSGSTKHLVNMVEFKFTRDVNFTEMVMLASFLTIRMGMISPTGYMTCAAFTNYKSKVSPGIECIILSMINILLNVYYILILHCVAGALGAILGLKPKLVYLPSTGLYYAMIPQFLAYMECPTTFIILYFLSFWLFDVVRLGLALHFLLLNLYDFLPALTKYETYSKIVTGLMFIPLSYVISQENFAKLYMPNFEVITNHYLHGILLITESFMVFYCYGVSRLNDDIHFATGKRPIKFWRIMWYFYPIFIIFGLCLSILGRLQNKLYKLPIISKDMPHLPKHMLFDEKAWLGILFIIYLLTIFVSSFIYIIVGLKSSMPFMDLFKPDFYWGPQGKKSRVARKVFAPRTSVRSQPPKKKKQRFRTTSIKQMHERDIAERVTRGRVFLDAMVFKNDGKGDTRLSRQFTSRYESRQSFLI